MPTILATYALCDEMRVKQLAAVDGADVSNEDKLRFLINVASTRIMDWSGREFKPRATNPATRIFEVDENGVVHLSPYELRPTVGPATVSTIYAGVTTPLIATDYTWPVGDTVSGLELTLAPLMGTTVSVTGTWGWGAVPWDVEYACARTVAVWLRQTQSQPQEFPDEGIVPVTPPLGIPSGIKRELEQAYRVPVIA